MADLPVIADLNRKIAKLERRSDAAANFARSKLAEYRDQILANAERLQREEKSLGVKYKAMRQAQAALSSKRAALEAAMQKLLAPLVEQERAARAAYDAVAPTYVPTVKYSGPLHAFVFAGAGDTAAIAELADKEARHIHHNRIAAEQLALNQRNIGANEMVAAILEEHDHDDPAAWVMFHARWRYWAGANGVNPGPIDQHYGPEVMGTVKRALRHIARSIDRVL